MVNDNAEPLADDDVSAPQERARRERSAVAFPYSDLKSAVRIAQMVHEKAGTVCEYDQLATWLNQSADGGTFRSRLSAARMFGLVEIAQGKVMLTTIGREALDEETGRPARAEAFLKVPLYQAMYEQFRGHTLPPAAAIERQMVNAGVSSKQSDRARQAFMNSATYAGYIDQNSGRFVKPGTGPGGARSQDGPERKPGGSGDGEPPGPPANRYAAAFDALSECWDPDDMEAAVDQAFVVVLRHLRLKAAGKETAPRKD